MTYTEAQYNDVLQATAASLQLLRIEKDGELATLQARFDAVTGGLISLQTLQTETITAVMGLIERGDMDEMIEFARQFTTPLEEKERLADLAQAAELESRALELRAKYE